MDISSISSTVSLLSKIFCVFFFSSTGTSFSVFWESERFIFWLDLCFEISSNRLIRFPRVLFLVQNGVFLTYGGHGDRGRPAVFGLPVVPWDITKQLHLELSWIFGSFWPFSLRIWITERALSMHRKYDSLTSILRIGTGLVKRENNEWRWNFCYFGEM